MEAMALYTGQPFQMAMTPVQTVMVLITLVVSAINLNDGETNAIEGMTHFRAVCHLHHAVAAGALSVKGRLCTRRPITRLPGNRLALVVDDSDGRLCRHTPSACSTMPAGAGVDVDIGAGRRRSGRF
jgi:hypothetical protein